LHEAREVLRIKLPTDKNAALPLNPGEEPFDHASRRNRFTSGTTIENVLLRKMIPDALPLLVAEPNPPTFMADRARPASVLRNWPIDCRRPRTSLRSTAATIATIAAAPTRRSRHHHRRRSQRGTIASAYSDAHDTSSRPEVCGSVRRWRCQYGNPAGNFTPFGCGPPSRRMLPPRNR
jgi:hypothetical protein